MTTTRRQPQNSESGIDALTRQMREHGLLNDGQVVSTDTEGPKLSAVLLEFIEPYKKDAPTREAYEKLVAMAVISWNAAIESGAKRKNYVRAMVKAIVDMAGEEWRRDAENIIEMMIRRKERYFAEDKRYIVDYRVTETSQEYHLSVASFVTSSNAPNPGSKTTWGDSRGQDGLSASRRLVLISKVIASRPLAPWPECQAAAPLGWQHGIKTTSHSPQPMVYSEHLAWAEAGHADYPCACDDRFLKRARAIKRLGTKVVSPVELIGELERW